MVVFGHLVIGNPPEGHDWYWTIRDIIYKFHMPFFMYLSGFVFFYNYKPILSYIAFSKYFSARVFRLLLPFMLFGVAIVSGKYILSYFVHVDNVPESIFDGLKGIFGPFQQSPVRSIWYIFVLFIYCIITPLLIIVINYFSSKRKSDEIILSHLVCLMLFAIILHLMALGNMLPDFIFIERIGYFYMFFIIGGFFALNYQKVFASYDRSKYMWLFAFAASFIVIYFTENSDLSKTVIGIFSIPALHSLARSDFFKGEAIYQRMWQIFGKHSYVIYLLNLIMIGVAKAVIFKFTSWDGVNFWWVLPVLLFFGLIVPIIVNQYIIKKLPIIKDMLK